MGRRKSQLAAGLLLQRRGGERRLRIAARRLGFHGRNRELGRLDRAFQRLGLGAAADVEPLNLLAVGADQPGLEGVTTRGGQRRNQRPVFPRYKFLDLELAVADQPQRHRLHPPGGTRARQFAPQHRREREADQIIQRATGHIGIDQRAIDLARRFHGLRHRLLGDGVEHHPLDLMVLDRALFLEHFKHVPGDRLALAIGVGRQDQPIGALQRLGDVVEPTGRLGVDLPDHLEVSLRIDRSILGRKVPDMAERGQDLVGRTQIFVDRLGFRGRLDNDDIHFIPVTYGKNKGRSARFASAVCRANMGAAGPPVKSTDDESADPCPGSRL